MSSVLAGDEMFERDLEILKRGATHLNVEEDLVARLREFYQTGTQMRVKLGADPSSSDLHLGHAVVLRKLRQFQDLGHKVVLIIGDFTATIGDPTGKSKTRPTISLEQTRANAETYVNQIGKILDLNPTKFELTYNSAWLEKMNYSEVIRLAQTYTVARLLERDDFAKRFKSSQPIGVHEFLYPLTQGYDSVAVRADVELGGNDQLFNNLVGREVQKSYGMRSQVVMTCPLLTGTDGVEKMSKSLNNYIGISEAPESIYRKAMQIPDAILMQYFTLCTALPLETFSDLVKQDPFAAHAVLARELVRIYHGEESVASAERMYKDVAAKKIPTQIKEFVISKDDLQDGEINICKLLMKTGLAASMGDARRLIQNRGIKIDNAVVEDAKINIRVDKDTVLQKGRDSFIKVKK